MTAPKLDTIGEWSEIKLEIIRKYAAAYSKILSSRTEIKKHIYIDAFAGAGSHLARRSNEIVEGSPRIALQTHPQFSEYHFIDLDGDRVDELKRLAGGNPNVFVYKGDCNKILLEEIFPRCQFKNFSRALCLLDPYNISVDWKVIQTAGAMGTIEIFYNFMIMDANMNIFKKDRDKVNQDQANRLTAVWGDESWQSVAWSSTPGLFGEMYKKSDNDTVAEALQTRLKEVAGFKFVPKPIPMRITNGPTIYYLYFASPNKTGNKIVSDIFKKQRGTGI